MVWDTQQGETRRPAGPSAESVAAYLAEHPDFLIEHPDLLARLTPPPPTNRTDGVIDLRAYMLERMKAEVERLRQQQRALISATRANQNTLARAHAAILFLLDAESFEQLIQTITTDLAVLLDLDVASLLIESAGHELARASTSGIQVVAEGFINRYLAGRDILLEGDTAGDEAIFGAGAGLVRSQALVRLNVSSETPACMLALGSREPDLFHAGLRTELLSFLARVLERCIRSWLDLPA